MLLLKEVRTCVIENGTLGKYCARAERNKCGQYNCIRKGEARWPKSCGPVETTSLVVRWELHLK